MISVREKRNETILIQNNKLIYTLAINTCLLFFTFSGIFNILKNNIVQVYLDTVLIFVCHFLFRCFSKFKKKSFIKINSQNLEISSVYSTFGNGFSRTVSLFIANVEKQIPTKRVCLVSWLNALNSAKISTLLVPTLDI